MVGIPPRCPRCNNKKLWKEEINPLITGIPIGNGIIRIRFLAVRGLLARPIKKKLGCYNIKYRCQKCGYEETYDQS